MTTTSIIILNLVFAALAAGVAVAAYRLAHGLPQRSPLNDERWGTGGDPWVPSAPLPLHQVSRHEDDRADAVAA